MLKRGSSGGYCSLPDGDHDGNRLVEEVLKSDSAGRGPHALLQVPHGCSLEQAKTAYKKLALALHPDKNHHPRCADAFQAVRAAYQSLQQQGGAGSSSQSVPSQPRTNRWEEFSREWWEGNTDSGCFGGAPAGVNRHSPPAAPQGRGFGACQEAVKAAKATWGSKPQQPGAQKPGAPAVYEPKPRHSASAATSMGYTSRADSSQGYRRRQGGYGAEEAAPDDARQRWGRSGSQGGEGGGGGRGGGYGSGPATGFAGARERWGRQEAAAKAANASVLQESAGNGAHEHTSSSSTGQRRRGASGSCGTCWGRERGPNPLSSRDGQEPPRVGIPMERRPRDHQEARSAWSRPKPQPSLAREGSSPPGAVPRDSCRGLEDASWHGAWAAARAGGEGSGKSQAAHDGVDREERNNNDDDEELWGNLYGSFAFDSQKERSGTDSPQSSLSGENGGDSGEDGAEEACGGIGDPHFCPPPLHEDGDGDGDDAEEEDDDDVVSDSEPEGPGAAAASWRPPQRSWAHREDATRDQLQELLEQETAERRSACARIAARRPKQSSWRHLKRKGAADAAARQSIGKKKQKRPKKSGAAGEGGGGSRARGASKAAAGWGGGGRRTQQTLYAFM